MAVVLCADRVKDVRESCVLVGSLTVDRKSNKRMRVGTDIQVPLSVQSCLTSVHGTSHMDCRFQVILER